ncbi:ATPase family AAA domain-containing protein 5b [Genypterus blacodes]|uniref:ATPase family AAA domain-containing protein 5b n=1 Tax=Genypterus blacodes TaxID=154954 RepID=UPI003F7588DC
MSFSAKPNKLKRRTKWPREDTVTILSSESSHWNDESPPRRDPITEDGSDVAVTMFSAPTAHHLIETLGSNPSTWRTQMSPAALHSCLRDIQMSNPAFPVQRVFAALHEKGRDGLQDGGASAATNSASNPPQSHVKDKRKRGMESYHKVSKCLRSGLAVEDTVDCPLSEKLVQDLCVSPAKMEPRGSRLSRTHRLKLRSKNEGLETNKELNSARMRDTASQGESLTSSHLLPTDPRCEDVLWTEKYSPQHSSQVIDNTASVKKLHSWLKKWKQRADGDEERREEERKRKDHSNELWDSGDFQGEARTKEDREETPCSAVLLTGPPGVGKTAAVYACAQELGFKVFEVNSSSQRSGRLVLSQLKEATQSHLVETSGKDSLRPAYFNSYNICTTKSETGKNISAKTVTSTSKKRSRQSSSRSGRNAKTPPPAVTLADFFETKAKVDRLRFGCLPPSEEAAGKTISSPSPSCEQTRSESRMTVTSLILFEEVDVIFDEDVGFLAAIKTFMSTTKRPVILTTNDPSFRRRFDGSLEEIVFKTLSVVNVCSYLQLVCLAEDAQPELDDVRDLLSLCGGDVRRCLLQLQLWVHSTAGRTSQRGGLSKEHSEDDPESPGCTGTMLGLQSATRTYLLNCLKASVDMNMNIFSSDPDMAKLLILLAESWRRGVPLLYSNLELLLPIRATHTSLPVHHQAEVPQSGLQSEPAPSHRPYLDGNVHIKATTTDNNTLRNVCRLSRKKSLPTLFGASSSNTSMNPHRSSSSLMGAYTGGLSTKDTIKQDSAKVSAISLDALTDFFDLMSYIDAITPAAKPHVPEEFVWTGAEIKDGLADEMSEVEDGSQRPERLQEIQAAVEGLGCHRCWWQLSEAWTEARRGRRDLGDKERGRLTERQTGPNSSLPDRRSLSFSLQPLCEPSVAQRRYELSRTVLASRSFCLAGNTRAVALDYMPVVRSICRSDAAAAQQPEETDRCVNYISRLRLGLSKSTIQLLTQQLS